jgi:tRNA(Ile)-lysidine synthase
VDIINKVKETINKYSMLSDGNRVLIGLSGGPDSICLAVILDELKEYFNLYLNALYIDHGLRPAETDIEVSFCKAFCDERKINFMDRTVNVEEFARNTGMNLQEAARELRYQVFDEISIQIKAESIALGHNADDQAETVLMRMLRGAGRKGLSGIPPVRGKIIRPLIEVERRDIEEFLCNAGAIHKSPLQSGRPFVIDSSNLKDKYFRNWIRHTLIGEIRKKNPSAVRDLCRIADIFREEDEYLEIVVTKTLMKLISRKSDTAIELFIIPLETIEKPILRRVLRRAIDATRGLRGIGYIHIEDIINLIKKGRAGDRLILPKDIRVIREYSLLKITTEQPEKITSYVLKPPCKITIEGTGMVLRASYEDKNDAAAMEFSLKVRARAEGDFFYPIGFGKRKKLQDFFVDEKIPRDDRDKIPVVLSGDDIIWVAGYRADERFKVTDRTEKVLRLKISRMESK